MVAACFALAVAAQPAAAATNNCPTLSSSPVFAALGDHANYTPIAGGTFEGNMTGWSFDHAAVAPGNEPWHVDGSSDDQSLSIASGGSATSPTFCVNDKTPSWRFFANAADGSSSTVLHVAAQLTDKHGRVMQVPIATLHGGDYTSWQATPSLILGKVLPPGCNVVIRFVFSADPNGGAWSIDDTFVDPYAK